jgi:ribosome-binding factor A
MNNNTDSRRTHKVASLIRSELARLLIEEISDPRLKEVVITEVELSRDLKHARVLFAKGEGNLKEINQGLNRAVPFFRRKLADNLQLRYVPELGFQVDTHGDSLNRLLHLFDDVASQRSGNESV